MKSFAEINAIKPKNHGEEHLIKRIGWVRAAVLGANDGIISIASLMVGVASASSDSITVLISGIAGLVAGAFSMAAGEYVSVSSQSDIEKFDLEREAKELQRDPEGELMELAHIYVGRGLSKALALQVAKELTAHNALATHARDELGIVEHLSAQPWLAAFTSAITFALGAGLPLLVAVLVPNEIILPAIFLVTLLSLAILGALGAKIGGAGMLLPSVRVTFWGALAMAVTMAIGYLVGLAL